MTYSFAQKAREAGFTEEGAQLFSHAVPALWHGGIHTANEARQRHAETQLKDVNGLSEDGILMVEAVIFGVNSVPIDAMFPQIEVIAEHLRAGGSSATKGNSKKNDSEPTGGNQTEGSGNAG